MGGDWRGICKFPVSLPSFGVMIVAWFYPFLQNPVWDLSMFMIAGLLVGHCVEDVLRGIEVEFLPKPLFYSSPLIAGSGQKEWLVQRKNC